MWLEEEQTRQDKKMNSVRQFVMNALGRNREAMGRMKIDGKSTNGLVTCTVKRGHDFIQYVDHLHIDPMILKTEPDKVPSYVKEAINDALKKDLDEVIKFLPEDVWR